MLIFPDVEVESQPQNPDLNVVMDETSTEACGETGGENQILIDFDLRKSVHKAGPNYRLKPALRLLKIDNVAKQRLRGEWLAEAMGQCESPMAYIL